MEIYSIFFFILSYVQKPQEVIRRNGMFVASLSKIKMDCLGIRFYWLFICDRGPQSKSINQSAVAGSKFATNENIFCSFSPL